MTIIEHLERCLQPQYVGWKDQYEAVLNALGIFPSDNAKDVLKALGPLHVEFEPDLNELLEAIEGLEEYE